jgi:hypothetical protein
MPSNHGQPNVPLTNIEVMERVARFLRTGDVRHLPPALRHEAEGIVAMCAAALATGKKPWPAGAAQPEPSAASMITTGSQFSRASLRRIVPIAKPGNGPGFTSLSSTPRNGRTVPDGRPPPDPGFDARSGRFR